MTHPHPTIECRIYRKNHCRNGKAPLEAEFRCDGKRYWGVDNGRLEPMIDIRITDNVTPLGASILMDALKMAVEWLRPENADYAPDEAFVDCANGDQQYGHYPYTPKEHEPSK